MSKEELFDQGWDLIYSGPTGVKAWGNHMVELRHSDGRMASGYGTDEQESLNDAAATIQKSIGVKQ